MFIDSLGPHIALLSERNASGVGIYKYTAPPEPQTSSDVKAQGFLNLFKNFLTAPRARRTLPMVERVQIS